MAIFVNLFQSLHVLKLQTKLSKLQTKLASVLLNYSNLFWGPLIVQT